ncbi:hypothetical protein [Amphritea balenae]|nr:hypothetical protein [Amphritea balenae]GGK56358.1 hypothetical protein GCM10007941_03180 [Amphritea balenae]
MSELFRRDPRAEWGFVHVVTGAFEVKDIALITAAGQLIEEVH